MDIFADLGCTYKTTYTGLSRPFCAAAIDTCINPCFPDNTILQTAIIYYIGKSCSTNSTCAVGTTWGWPVGTWCTKLVNDMSYLFFREYAFNKDISGWDVGSVRDMGFMFYEASAFNQNISGWDSGLVTT